MSIFNKQGKEVNLQESGRDFKEIKILEVLQQTIPNTILTQEGVYIKEVDLVVDTRMPYINGSVVQFTFVLKHKLFQEEIIEFVVGTGPTFNSAIEEGVINFNTSILVGVIKALKCEDGKKIKANILDKVHSFICYEGGKIQHGSILSDQNIDFWDLIEEDLMRCIGNKKIYLIKMYASKVGGKVNCECRVNGILYPNLTKKLNNLISCGISQAGFYSQKQFFVVLQDEMSHTPYPLTKKEVESYTLNALLLYRECHSKESYKELFNKILEICPNKSLATELYSLIPEIVTEIIFCDVNYSDEILVVRGEERHHLFKHQLTSYDWIYNVVDRTIRAGYFEKAQIDSIIYHSASFNSIQEALNKGSKIKNISMLGVGIPVPLEYEVL